MTSLRRPLSSGHGIYSESQMRSHIETIGTCNLVLSNSFVFNLEKTFYVSSFSRNLISVSRFVPLGYSFHFYETSTFFKDITSTKY